MLNYVIKTSTYDTITNIESFIQQEATKALAWLSWPIAATINRHLGGGNITKIKIFNVACGAGMLPLGVIGIVSMATTVQA